MYLTYLPTERVESEKDICNHCSTSYVSRRPFGLLESTSKNYKYMLAVVDYPFLHKVCLVVLNEINDHGGGDG